MNRNFFLTAFISCLLLTNAYCQTCRVSTNTKLNRSIPSQTEEYNSLVFDINGSIIKATDTSTFLVSLNTSGFDTIKYSYVNHKKKICREVALCKFHSNELYTISPCTCCGIFLIIPSKNASRGFVKFVNHSNRSFLGLISDFDYNKIPKKSETKFLFSSISMNCGFRPSDISIMSKEYLSPKYDYENWSEKPQEDIDRLLAEQEKHVLYHQSFLFLHEEKLIITIDSNLKAITLKLKE